MPKVAVPRDGEKNVLNPLNLTPLNVALEKLEDRQKTISHVEIEDPRALQFRWEKNTPSGQEGFMLGVDTAKLPRNSFLRGWFDKHGEMEISQTGVKAMLGLGSISIPREVIPKRLPGVFIDAMNAKMEDFGGLRLISGAGRNGRGKRVVESFCKGNMSEVSDLSIMNDMVLNTMRQMYGDECIQGVRFHTDMKSSTRRYQIVFGKPLIKESDWANDPQLSTWPMVDVTANDLGLAPVELGFGLLRLRCINGSTYSYWDAGRASWNRNGDGTDWANEVKNVVRLVGGFARDAAVRLAASAEEKVGSPEEVIHRLKAMKILPTKQADQALQFVERDNPTTEFEMFQILTESAHELDMIPRRRAEMKAMAILRAGGSAYVSMNGLDMDDAETEAKNAMNDIAATASK